MTNNINKTAEQSVRQIAQLAILLLMLEAADVMTTTYGTQHNLTELNPTAHITPVTTIIKIALPLILFLIATITITVACQEQNTKTMKATVYLFLAVTIIMTAVIINNIICILKVT